MLAKKSLGQHWLRSERVAKLIVQTAEIKSGETVLEIGPGTGFLTKFLLEKEGSVIAIEKDDRAILLLQEKFSEEIKNGKLEIIHTDILDFDIEALRQKLKAKSYKVVANIPYYITGQIIRKFLSETKQQPEKMVLLVQDEVARRIVAQDKKESLLSVSVKAYGNPKYIQKVPAKLFLPIPKVHSAILLIDQISKNNFENISEQKFFEIVKSGFSSKRKMLRNHLELAPETFAKCGVSDKSRAENLTLENWLCLARN
ncbi:MAG: 16S rRNA (adenine(1518)-N(6)/adenine(1519)-N(6))-dimethyltransferase RsmA [Patescibacteria group bacterium]